MISILYKYIKKHKKLFFIDLTCAIFVSVVDLCFPFVSRYCLYELLPKNKFNAFFLVIFIVFIAYLLKAVFSYIVWYLGHYFGILVESDMRNDLFSHIINNDISFFDKERIGKLMSRMTTDLFEISELCHHGPEDIIVATFTIIGSLAIMFSIEWHLALTITILTPFVIYIVVICRRDMSDASKKQKEVVGVINSSIESAFSGIRVTKAFNNEQEEIRKFEISNDKFRVSKKKLHRAMAKFNSLMELFVSLLSVIIIFVGGILIMYGKLNIIDMIVFTLYITTFVTPIRRMAVLSDILVNGFAGLSNFNSIMSIKRNIVEKENPVILNNIVGNVSFRNVCFRYDDDKGKTVLNDFSLEIKEGMTIGLVGPSGGGKTTISNLLPRFYDIYSGKITIDSIDIKDISFKSLRDNIGIVEQNVFLFADTIKENIRYGKLTATDEEIYEAAKCANIYDDILKFEKCFDTYVGERGILLSGGQKQRISIARMFLKNPKILILDEATSALDSVTETKIEESFKKLSYGRTSIVIAHRISTIKNADMIVFIDNGSVIEKGTHDELMALNGRYAEIVNVKKSMVK